MALLYVAKRNSEELVLWAEEHGKAWQDLFSGSSSSYALEPNMPFDLAVFAELSDDKIETYANAVCSATPPPRPAVVQPLMTLSSTKTIALEAYRKPPEPACAASSNSAQKTLGAELPLPLAHELTTQCRKKQLT